MSALAARMARWARRRSWSWPPATMRWDDLEAEDDQPAPETPVGRPVTNWRGQPVFPQVEPSPRRNRYPDSMGRR